MSFLAEFVTLWGPTLEVSVPEGLGPMERTHTGAVCQELQPLGRTHMGEVHGGLFSVKVTSHRSRESVRNPPCKEEGARECDELTTISIHCPTALLLGRWWRNQE